MMSTLGESRGVKEEESLFGRLPEGSGGVGKR